MPDRHGPYRSYRFRLEVNGTDITFSQATIPETTSEPIEYREGNEGPTMRKLAGLVSYGNLTLQKGVTDGSLDELFTWRKQVEDGNLTDARRTIAVVLLDEEGNDATRWEFTNAWPTQYDAPDLDASANEVAVESLEIVHEGMTRKEP
ncbi:conserved hypothetical phage tail region protein [Halogranum amylolyticum]|uniref:Conserved hypothetical phage tail region protein n=1 Tax=Halogranum amylolyticum TaxID=660520 RepID=A0A1H8WFR6_9EURY|nr:phage tail protein [Halogranum amylolyticum]SEP26471.1 conserved hypothetical phage tail region protein [Halogranum amylolyticum]